MREDVFVFPMSFVQERLWFLAQLEPESASYNLATAVRLAGSLDVSLVERCVSEIVRRHEVLRTTFDVVDGQPSQVVHADGAPRIERIDLGALPAAQRDAEVRRLIEREARRPFDTASGPLLRLTLLRLGSEEHILLWVVHHLVFDGWSTSLVLAEFAALYTAFSSGRPAPLADLPLQYADFAHWQRERVEGGLLEAQLAYWKRQLGGQPGLLELPADRPRPAIQRFRGARHFFRVPGALAAALGALARREETTLFAALMAGFQALLARRAGTFDISVGTPVTNRSRAELEGLVGCFANTAVVRADLSGDPPFAALLARVTAAVREAQAHQEVPFDQVVEAVSPVRDLSHAPLCQVMFALQPALRQAPAMPGLEVRLLDLDVGGAQFDLSLNLATDEDGLAGALEYDTDLFDARTVARMADELLRLLAGAAASPATRLSELPLLAPEERRQVLEWSAAGALGEAPQAPRAAHAAHAAHRRFEEQAARAPEATAVVHEAQQITYGELDRRANQLAQLLRRRGVGPEIRVGICLPRSIGRIAAVLGALKAGGAFVPLDPDAPRERIAEAIGGAGIRVVIARGGAAAEPPPGVEVILLDDAWTCVLREPPTPPAGEPAPEQAACVRTTSGAAGTPESVVVPHRALASFADAAAAAYGISQDDRVLELASMSLDAGAAEFFACLARGATLVLPTEATLESTAGLLSTCDASRVTVAVLPTLHWHRAVAGLDEGLALPACLRQIVVTGEAALPARVRAFRALPGAARVRLLNAYGAAETTATATACDLTAAEPRDVWAVPIGRPLAGARAYVLDPAGQPVPAGVVGELYLGGQVLARGYLGRADLTAERFVPDPFADQPGARLYRTGDRARWRADGQLELAGRVDRQVNLRGFRIDPGEVEARLGELPGVREAVVIARQDRPEERRLVAYVAAGADVAPEELRRALKERLPDFMAPSALVALTSLPRTPRGKIDRRALPAPVEASGQATTPRTEAEATLAGIWAELLGRQAVGVQENFFELGGDSILALQVVSRARAAGLSLTPRQVFQHQTIAGLAAVAASGSTPAAEARRETPLPGDAPLTPVQRWFFELDGPNPHHWNQTVLLELRQRVSVEALTAAIEAAVEHHGALRLRFTREEGGWSQHFADSPPAAVARVDLSGLPAEAQPAALARAAAEHQARLHLSEGPVLCAVLFDLGPERPGRLLLVAHHLVIDAVSWRILIEDLQTACQQHERGEAIRLPEEIVSFGEWAWRLFTQAQSEEVTRQAEAWLAASRPARALPADDPAGASLEADTVSLTRFLDAEDTRALLQAAPAYRLRVDEVLLAAFAGALAQWTGDPAVLIDLEGHGRDALDDLDLSRTVGWFTSIYPVRLEIPAGAAPERALKALKEQLRAAPQGGATYGMLRYLSEDAQAARLRERAAAQVRFNYLGRWDDLFASSPLFAHAEGDVGRNQDPRAPRGYELEVDAAVVDGRLRVMWSTSGARYRPETVARLFEDFAARLRALVAHDLAPDAGGYTPSDFPLARLDQTRLDRLLGPGRDVEDVYPLSPLQQGLLFHSLWELGSGVYVEQVTCRLEGALDVDAFREAWQAVALHHGVLRTTFAWEGADEPLQVVRRGAAVAIEIEDWRDARDAGVDAQRARLKARIEADRARGFDLARGPLMRVALLRVADEAYQFLWSHHHLLLDGWAASLVLQDAFAAYDALRAGRPVALSPRPRYREYIAWLRERDASADEGFWRSALAGFSAATPLPLERVPPAEEASGHGATIASLPEPVTARLQRFAQQHHVTSSTLVQSAWALVLSRAARSDDVVFGVTVAGRSAPLAGIDAMVGIFINTLPLRVAVPQAATVADWLRDLLRTTTDLGPHEHTPLAQARAFSAIPAGQPLFESLLVFENYPIDPRTQQGLPGLAVRDVAFADQTNYPLTLAALPGAQLQLRLSYDRRRFDEEVASRLLGLVEVALRQIVSRPDARVGELSLLGELESRRVVTAWNATERAYPRERHVHELFEAQAARTPDAVAVIFGERRLSYRELNARANRVAHALRKRGVGPDVLVAIAAERSVELVVGLLGILKAGGAYVPIDPDYPADRIAYMLEDAAAPVLLSQWPVASRLPPHRAQVLCLDSDRATIDKEPAQNPAVAVSPDNLAYTIYTSGSTGRPKGAGNSHRGLLNRLQWMQERYGLTPQDRVLQKTPFSFDVSVWEFFWPLMTGAGLVVAKPGDHRDGERLVALITRSGVTTLHFVPPMLQAFLETPDVASCRSLRRVICSGEALPAELARRCFERLPDAEIHNLYGPTEASIDVTFWACQREDTSASVPIGYPIANTQIYLLDRHGQPVPAGVAGELHIGGVGLARGYHRRPDLTAERFVPDPFGSAPGGRLYRTGDLARHRPDGAIEFLGRLDHQVKIRGLRIELGEIEARLLQHPGVGEAVVLARDEAHGGKRLVAYVAGRDGAALDAKSLRAWLAEALPAYMVPAPILVLDRLPLSPNGKVDRRALPAPEQIEAPVHRPHVAPRTEPERFLAEIWAEVLRREQVGVEDDFFELGGDSIVTLQIIARAAQRGLRLTPKQIFTRRTIAALAGDLAAAQAAPLPPAAPAAIAPFSLARLERAQLDALLKADDGIEDVVPASPVQQGMLFHSLLTPEDSPYFNQIVCRFTQGLDVEAFSRAFEVLGARHAILRTGFVTGVEEPHQVVRRAARLPLEVLDWREVPEAEQAAALERFLRDDRRQGLRFEEPPLMRVSVLRLSDRVDQIVWSVHHALLDGWCQGLILEEWLTYYDEARRGALRAREEEAPPYKRYVAWLERQDTAAAEAFFRAHLKGLTAPTPLPALTAADAAAPGFREHRARLSAGATRALQGFAQAQGVTLNTAVQAAWALLLARESREPDVLFGVTVAGRPADLPEAGSIMGVFINSLPLRLRVDPEAEIAAWLRGIQELNLELRQHEHSPLVQVQQWSDVARGAPLFESLLVFQNYPIDEAVEQHRRALGIEVSTAEAWTNYPLTVAVVPGDELALSLSFDARRLGQATVARMAADMCGLLERMAGHPEARLLELAALEDGEQERLAAAWRAPRRDDEPAPSPGGERRRKAGHAPGVAARAAGDRPRTATEETVAGIWADVLGQQAVGVDESFFEIGGHSLLATRVISRVRAAFQVELPLRALFDHPTVTALARAVDDAVRQQQGVALPPITPQPAGQPDGGAAPLSFAQQRLWFLAQLEPTAASYNIPAAVRLTGTLDVDRLRRGFEAVVRRHASMRTTFAEIDGGPAMIVRAEQPVALSIADLRAVPAEEREAAARRALEAEASRAFDLTEGPLFRITLLRLGEREHTLLVVLHHIVSDGWSLSLLVDEVMELYAADAEGRAAELPALPVQYGDYTRWQRDWLDGPALDQQLAYFLDRLGSEPAALSLPTDRPPPAAQSYRGARYAFALPTELSAELLALARQRGVTPFVLLLAVFQALLAKYGGRTDLWIGTPVANRAHLEVQDLIGFFVNTLVLRADLSDDPRLTDLLPRVREEVLGAQAHQDLPFEHLVKALRPARDLSRSPLFQVMFTLHQPPSQAAPIAGLEVRPLEVDPGSAQFDLSLDMTLQSGELSGSFEYSTDLFDRSTIARMALHLERLLAAAAARPTARLSELSMLAPAELARVLAWGGAAAPDRTPRLVHRRFEEQAARAPEAVAVVHEQRSLAYAELDRRANQLAHLLRRHGVGPEVRVGVCLSRSTEMIAAVLGVLKAGGAYVPIDPNTPDERVAVMVADAGIRVVIAGQDTADDLPDGLDLVRLEPGWACLQGEPATPPPGETAPEQTAYILYTSGSTGTPKGVVIPHRALASFVDAAAVDYAISSSDRVLQFASLSFDASAEEIFPCFARGATLVLRTDAMLESAAGFLAACGAWGVTAAVLPTMYWHRIVAELGEDLTLPPCLRQIVITGEAALPERVSAWRASPEASRVRLLNAYGPTETTVTATVSDLSAAADPRDAWVVPIGRPLANTRAYVLDHAGQPAPAGVVGELYLGGQGLARGYWARPDLTAERFVPDPFSDRPGDRLYRTGDLARWRADGQIEFAGRIDHQVKLRGIRIELGEIEARLAEHAAASEVAVLAREDEPGVKRLVAYVVPSDPAPAADELRAFLQTRLPDYMVPSAFVFLPALPHTTNGKVNRRALPAPVRTEAERAAPREAVEAQLAQIWAEVLGHDTVGIHDNFFEVGGDSILSLQVVARAREAGLQITPRQIFLHQTVAALAPVAGRAAAGATAEQRRVTGQAPLTPIQRWFFAQPFPNPHHWNQSVLLALLEPLDWASVEAAVPALLDHHDALRLRFLQDGAGWRQVHAPEERAQVARREDLSAVPDGELPAAIAERAARWQADLSLTDGPLFRVIGFDLGPSRPGRLLLIAHHLVVDGVSWRILLQDLEAACAQARRGEPIRLPAKTSSYRRWAERLEAAAQGPALQREAAFWLDLPWDRVASPVADDPSGERTETVMSRVAIALGDVETRALLEDVPEVYRTRIEEVLLTALSLALARWTGGGAVAIDVEGHGREELDGEDLDLSRTVGWFTSVYPVLLEVAPDAAPGAVLKAVKEQVRRIPRRGLPYGAVRELGTGALADRLRRLPTPSVCFNYLGQWDQVVGAGARVSVAAESSGPEHDPRSPLPYEIEIDASVYGGRLEATFRYSAARYRQETIAAVGALWRDALRALIAHCLSPDAGGYTPADFTDVALAPDELDSILERLD
ncbi:non-ribosomal peptide synthase/polyketide synthase [Sorangium sp. So ce1000]|uniref:non-ribosomal peptide synthase/polyketide synthase n=1 Tax=Sorangium sp. So ce1000 TaxID=3133325 RepID=UPI003F5DB480